MKDTPFVIVSRVDFELMEGIAERFKGENIIFVTGSRSVDAYRRYWLQRLERC